MFWQVICTCEGYYKLNYKYERFQCNKINTCCRNISCSFICSFMLLIFLSCGDLKFLFNVFHQINLMNKYTLLCTLHFTLFYFTFLKDLYLIFGKTCIPVNLFIFFVSYPVIFYQNTVLIDYQWYSIHIA